MINEVVDIDDSCHVDQNKNLEIIWHKCYSNEHNCYYYFNEKTQETSWELPNGTAYHDDNRLTSTTFHSPKQNSHQIPSLDLLISSLTPTRPDSSLTASENHQHNPLMSPTLQEYHSPIEEKESPINSTNSRNLSSSSHLHQQSTSVPSYQQSTLMRSIPNISEQSTEETIVGTEESLSDDNCSVNLDLVQRLIDMGFDEKSSLEALIYAEDDLTIATSYLLRKSKKSKNNSSFISRLSKSR